MVRDIIVQPACEMPNAAAVQAAANEAYYGSNCHNQSILIAEVGSADNLNVEPPRHTGLSDFIGIGTGVLVAAAILRKVTTYNYTTPTKE